MLRIYCEGVARIQSNDDKYVFEIHSDELEWQLISSDGSRGMGAEDIYEAKLDHESLGELKWSISEYPSGQENFTDTEVGEHDLLSDFKFGLTNDIVDEPTPENLPTWLREQQSKNALITKSEIVTYLVNWFSHYYEDPANETPYETKEGGYQWIAGGPYDAREELDNDFLGVVADEIINDVVQEIESDGLVDWAPSSFHPDKQRDIHQDFGAITRSEPSFVELQELVKSDVEANWNSERALAAKKNVLQKSKALIDSLPDRSTYGGIGHNRPPSEFELDNEQVKELKSKIIELETELSNKQPNIENVVEETSFPYNILSWVGEKLDITVDAFCKSFGTTLGKTAGVALPAVLISLPFWEKLAEFYMATKDLIMIALGI